MLNFLRRLFGFSQKKEKDQSTLIAREHVISHDMIDYDGMGNQGRFPRH